MLEDGLCMKSDVRFMESVYKVCFFLAMLASCSTHLYKQIQFYF